MGVAQRRDRGIERSPTVGGPLQGFKDFITRGNMVELAVAVVIAGAIAAVIQAIQDGLIAPLIARIVGKAEIKQMWYIDIGADAQLNLGLIIDALVVFVMTAAVVYFLIIVPMNRLAARRARGEAAEPEVPDVGTVLLTEIRDLLAHGGAPRA